MVGNVFNNFKSSELGGYYSWVSGLRKKPPSGGQALGSEGPAGGSPGLAICHLKTFSQSNVQKQFNDRWYINISTKVELNIAFSTYTYRFTCICFMFILCVWNIWKWDFGILNSNFFFPKWATSVLRSRVHLSEEGRKARTVNKGAIALELRHKNSDLVYQSVDGSHWHEPWNFGFSKDKNTKFS